MHYIYYINFWFRGSLWRSAAVRAGRAWRGDDEVLEEE